MTNHGEWKSVFAVVALALVVVPVSFADAFDHHGEENGYTVTFPDGWTQIPPGFVEEVMGMMLTEEAQGKLINDAAFQMDSEAGWFTYPYVLVQVLPYSMNGMDRQPQERNFEAMARLMTGKAAIDAADKLANAETKDIMSNMSAHSAIVDKKNRRITWTTMADVAGIGHIRGDMSANLGSDALINVNYYALSDEWDQHKEASAQILNSFRFDPSRAYNETLAERDKQLRVLGSPILRAAFVGGFIGLALWIVRKIRA